MNIKTVTGITLYESESESIKECIEEAILKGVILDNADFSNLDLEGINLIGQSLQWANFENANLSFSDLRGCNFSNSNLRRARFLNSKLQGAFLRDVDMNGVNFTNSNLQSADFRNSEVSTINGGDSFRKVNGAVFVNADLQSSIFNKMSFFKCDFSNSNLKNSSLRYTIFKNSTMENIDFTASKLHKITIEGCVLTKCNFWDVDMTKCEIYNCDISDTFLAYTTISLNCGFRTNKTSEIQRTFLSHFIFRWLENADNLSAFEEKLKVFISEYASAQRYSELRQDSTNIKNEFKSYVESSEQSTI